MIAAEVLSELQAKGVTLAPEGDKLRWRAPKGTMTPDLLARVREAKPALLALLAGGAPVPVVPRPAARPFGSPEAVERWPIWYGEMVVTNVGLGHDKPDAERLAFGQAIEAGCQRHHRAPPPEGCAGCGRPLGARAFGCGNRARVCERPDHGCLILYGTERQRQAALALRALDIEPPAGWTLPDGSTP